MPSTGGPPSALGIPVNDRVTLTGTPLSETATDTVVLSDTAAPFEQFSITEIRIAGRPATQPPLVVGVDILPGQKRATLSTRDDKPIPVAVLSSATFDAVHVVNKATLTFGRTRQEPSLAPCGKPKDVNRDHRPDLVCCFRAGKTGFRVGDTTGLLHGLTVTGRAFEGTDGIRVVR